MEKKLNKSDEILIMKPNKNIKNLKQVEDKCKKINVKIYVNDYQKFNNNSDELINF